jgi:arylsulfatase A-like enzyme
VNSQGAGAARTALGVVVAALLVLAGGCSEEPAPAGSPLRPNVLMISVDTLRADHVSAYGHDRPTTPAIDALAEEGVLFENAYSHAPVTSVSHMSLLTSLQPEAHGVSMWTDVATSRLSESIPTLATVLREHGYQTAARTAGGYMAGVFGFDQGFSAFHETYELEQAVDESLEELRSLAKGSERPFCYLLHTFAVHAPYMPEEPYRGMFADPAYSGSILSDREVLVREAGPEWAAQNRAYWKRVEPDDPADLQHLRDLYDAGIRRTDDQLARFLRELERSGLLKHTLIVFLSDHGDEFMEHGQFLHKQLYQELLHVPLVIRFAGDRGERFRGRREDALVRLIDVFPTVLDAAGLPIPDHVQGVSLLPLLEGEAAPPEVLLSSWRKRELESLRLGDWKLVVGPQGAELYDLARDPLERTDLSGREPARVAEMKASLAERVDASRRFLGHARRGVRVEPDPATRRRLRALGYVD